MPFSGDILYRVSTWGRRLALIGQPCGPQGSAPGYYKMLFSYNGYVS